MAALLLRGVGIGEVTIPLMAVAIVSLQRDEMTSASIICRTSMQIGGPVGVAVLAVILQGAATSLGPVESFQQVLWWAVGFTGLAIVLSFHPGPPPTGGTDVWNVDMLSIFALAADKAGARMAGVRQPWSG